MYYCANAFVVTITLQIYTIIIHMQICFLILYLLIYTQRDKEGKRERERDDLGE